MLGSPLFSQAIAAASGLFGAFLGGFLTSRNQRQERRQRFVRDQLAEFYAPALGIRARIRAKSEIRAKIANTAAVVWPRLMNEARESGLEQLRQAREELSPKFKKITEHDKQQFLEELIPLYRQMVELFTAKMHFAERSTQAHFSALVQFVELWDRYINGVLPDDVAERFEPNEENLMSFYADLHTNFERLQSLLKQ